MNTVVTVAGDVLRLGLPGRFDYTANREFSQTYQPWLEKPEIKFIEIDFSGTEYIDSAALGMLLLLRRHCKDHGKVISLMRAKGVVAEVLRIAQFDSLFGWRP
jgi:anti-anti-sigma factor